MILAFFLLFLFVQLMYHLFLFSRLAFYRAPQNTKDSDAKISVVVCCKNEFDTISKLMDVLLQQDAKDYEIIVVDDFSTDGSYEYLKSIQEEKVCIYQFHKNKEGKKEVLNFGIQQAKNDWILVCDADCIPVSTKWIQTMKNSLYNEEIEIVLGYAPFYDTNSWVNLMSRYENFMTGIFYLSMALTKDAYMGVGRNMLFKKSLYLRFIKEVLEINTISGDDDLFINKASTSKNTTICIEKDSFVYSASKSTIGNYIHQKKRHISTGYHYKLSQKLILSIYPISMLLLFVAYIAILLCNDTLILTSSMFLLVYLTTNMLVKTYCAEKLNFRSKCPVFILDIIFLCYQIIIHPLYLIKKNKQWQS